MLTAKEIRERDNILGEQIPGTPYFALTMVSTAGVRTSLGCMIVTPKQMLALYRDPANHSKILAASRRMPDDG